jgi:protein-disulfide isomerase
MSKSLPMSLLLVAALAIVGIGDVNAKPDLGPIPVTKADTSWGSPNAPVTIVHFGDLQCPFCKRGFETMEKLQKTYGRDKIRVVYKHFPLPFHKQAVDAARAAVAIKKSKGDRAAWRFVAEAYDRLPGKSDQFAVLDAASAAGIPRTALAGRNKSKIAKQVEDDMALGKKIGVRGTPATFVNGKFLSGAQSAKKFEELIDAQLIEAAKLRRSGVAKSRVSIALTKKNFVKPATPTAAAKPKNGPGASAELWKVPVGKSPVDGRRDALVTLVLFTDFQCPFCKRFNPTLEALRKKYKDDLRIVFKNNPLPFHKQAKPAAHLAMEAYVRQGNAGFWKAYDKLFENQRALHDADLKNYARELGLNARRTMAAVTGERHKKLIGADVELASDVSARGTPISFINGRKLSGAQPVEKLSALIDEELAKAKTLVAQGIPKSRVYAHIIKTGKAGTTFDSKNVPPPGKHTPIIGSKRAKVTIQAFTDFECPYCQRVQPTLERILDEYKGKVRIAFRHRPLAFHKNAMRAHNAAAEAFAQGGNAAFWKMHDKMFENTRKLDETTLIGYAQDIGLNVGKFKAALATGKHDKRVEADVKVAEKADINGTPNFVINGLVVNGAQPFSSFKKAIDQALNQAR